MPIRKRVFSILVEMLENVAKFTSGRKPEEQLGMPVAVIKMENKTYFLTTGNLLLNKNVEHLKEKIDTINKYNMDGLKKFFKVSLSEQTISSDSTGNMGLIDMAKKAGNKLIYQFETIDDTYSYFTLTVNVEDKIS